MPKDIIQILLLSLALIAIASISVLINSTKDIALIKETIVILFVMFTAYALTRYTKRIYQKVTFEVIANIYVIVALVQVIISLFFFFFPEIQSTALSILKRDELEESRIDELLGFRLIGFGAQFFGAGVTYSFILIVLAALLKNNVFSYKQTFLYIGIYLFIFALGMMTARTTIVGFLLSIPILVYNPKYKIKKQRLFKKVLLSIVIIASCIAIVIISLDQETKEELLVIVDFGFELFINLTSSGEITTSSTEIMKNMYIFPDNIKTWIIGDALFTNPNDGGIYYMETDIGYSRLLFYFGILGTLSYFLLHSAIIYFASKRNEKKYKFFFFIVFILFLTLNLKGITSLSVLVFPFLFVETSNKQQGDKLYIPEDSGVN